VFNTKTITWGGRNIVWNNTFYYYWGKEYSLLYYSLLYRLYRGLLFRLPLYMYTHGRINEDERKHEKDALIYIAPEIQQTLKF